MATERDDETRDLPDQETPAGCADGSDAGSLGAGQSGGGGYRNQDEQEPGGVGGQSHQGYYGGGQLGGRNFGDTDHSAASKGKVKGRS